MHPQMREPFSEISQDIKETALDILHKPISFLDNETFAGFVERNYYKAKYNLFIEYEWSDLKYKSFLQKEDKKTSEGYFIYSKPTDFLKINKNANTLFFEERGDKIISNNSNLVIHYFRYIKDKDRALLSNALLQIIPYKLALTLTSYFELSHEKEQKISNEYLNLLGMAKNNIMLQNYGKDTEVF
jgi:hypothetical protein